VRETVITRSPRVVNLPIRRAGLFALCSGRELARVNQKGDVVEMPADAVLQPQMPLHWVYVVFDGMLAVDTGQTALLIQDGGAIGVRSALTGGSVAVSITALLDTTLYVTTNREFAALAHGLRGVALGAARHLDDGPEVP
jgi:hypothetical protein